VTGTEIVQELRQFAVERSESCYRTCMGLYHNGAKMEEFIEVSSVEGIKNGSVIRFEEGEVVLIVIEYNYTMLVLSLPEMNV